MAKTAAIYARVSSLGQEKNYSLPTQLDSCQQYLQEQSLIVLPEHIFIESHTASVLSRPQMDKLLDLAETGAIDTLVLYCMDRLSRGGAGHQWYLENEFKRHGVKIVYALEQFEDTPEGDLHKDLQAAISAYERAKIVERTTRGRRKRAKDGKLFIPGGNDHYGYKYVSKTKDDPGHLEIVEAEAEIVRLIFGLYIIDKIGTRRIAAQLTEMGFPTRFDTLPNIGARRHKRNPGIWGCTTILSILKYEGYTGVHYFNRGTWVTGADGKKKRMNRDRSEWMPIQIPAIIDVETFQAAQARLQQSKRHVRREPKYNYLMRSRMTCAKCGSTFLVDSDTRSNGSPLQHYKCLGQQSYYSPDGKTKICRRYLSADEIDAVVWDYVRSLLREPETLTKVWREKQAITQSEAVKLQKRLEGVESKIANNLEGEKTLLNDFFDRSSLSRSALEWKAAQLTQMNVELQSEANDLRAKLAVKTIPDDKLESMFAWCVSIREKIDYMNFEERLAVIRLLNVTGYIQRGETPDQDTITVSGFLPTATLETGALLPNAITYTEQKHSAIPFVQTLKIHGSA